jgi:hypothetical protein
MATDDFSKDFGPQSQQSMALAEVSEAERRRCNRSSARGISLVRDQDQVQAAARRARIQDLSATGIGLLLQSSFPVGALLTVAPIGWRASRLLIARVVHLRHTSAGWLHGCQFTQPLSHPDLHEWYAYYCRQGC